MKLMKTLAAAALLTMGVAAFAATGDAQPKEEAPQAGPITVQWCPPLCL